MKWKLLTCVPYGVVGVENKMPLFTVVSKSIVK